MFSIRPNSVLLLIDVQKGFDAPYWGTRNNPDAEANMEELLQAWRAAKRPVIHVQHMSTEMESPLRPGQEGNEFKDFARPLDGEKVFQKQVNSSFIGTQLEEYLEKNDLRDLVICGLTTDHCVSTTTRMAGNLGFRTIVVADATATFDRHGYDGRYFTADEIHNSALASLHNEFAEVLNTDDVLGSNYGAKSGN